MSIKRQKGFTIIEVLISIVVMGVVSLGGWWAWHNHNKSTVASINSYADCVKAGFPITQSYPSICSANGKRFTNPADKNVIPSDLTGLAVLTGTVTEGPTMPACQTGSSCGAVVSNHTIEVLDSNGNIIDATKTDSNGKYTFHLKPGHYRLVLVPKVGMFIKVDEVDVLAGTNNFDLSADTGIR